MRRCSNRPFRPHRRFPAAVLPVFLSLALAITFFVSISRRLEPIIRTIATSNTINQISLAINQSAASCLLSEDTKYQDFVDIATDTEGRITSISFRMVEGNQFKKDFITALCNRLDRIESEALSVPLGNLSGILLFSAMGPDIRVSIQSVGDVLAVYENEFIDVGINQTKHMIYIKVSVTVYLTVPGSIIPVTVDDKICIAETIIVGDVPSAYLNLQDGDS